LVWYPVLALELFLDNLGKLAAEKQNHSAF